MRLSQRFKKKTAENGETRQRGQPPTVDRSKIRYYLWAFLEIERFKATGNKA
jgi:hypothetical protein